MPAISQVRGCCVVTKRRGKQSEMMSENGKKGTKKKKTEDL
jgi:hypothetical protein